VSVLTPPPQDELELLIREARARQRRRRLIGAAAVAIVAAAGLSLWAAIPGRTGAARTGGGAEGTTSRGIDNTGRVQVTKVGTSGGVTWAINSRGMWLTTNGGRTWRPSAPADLRRGGLVDQRAIEVAFVNPRRGWLLAMSATHRVELSRTTDGGRTWERLHPSGCCSTFDFLNRRRGLFFGFAGGLYETRDGGVTSRLVKGPALDGWPVFVDARHGVDLLDGGLLWTADGGVHWKDVLLSGQPAAAGDKTVVGGSVTRVGHRLVLTAERNSRTIPYFSNDAGAHWTPRPLPSAWVPYIGSNDGALFSAATATDWFAAARNELAVTTDAGRAWKIVHVADVPKRWIIGSIDFTSARVGWAIFDGPRQSYLMRTTDGGHHWTPAGPKARLREKHG
jgi:photosystem II stability/assembly factor-like uncharacterized protein